MTVMMPAVRKPRLMGFRASVSPSLAFTAYTPTMEARRRWPGRPAGRRGRGPGWRRRPRRPATPRMIDGDEGDLVALEQVGGHAGAVAHVVAHVVGDGGGVAGVVLGDARLDLADEVGADVGGLGEDAAADPEEQGEQRAAEAEADEDRRAGVLEDGDDDGGAEEAQAHGEHAGHAAGAERHLQGVGERVALGGGRRADVAAGGEGHADVAGEAGHEAAGDEGEGAGRARTGTKVSATSPFGLLDLRRGDEHDDGQRDQDHGDRAELALEVRRGALLDRLGDLDHLRRALVLRRGRPSSGRSRRRGRAGRRCRTATRIAHSPPFSTNSW